MSTSYESETAEPVANRRWRAPAALGYAVIALAFFGLGGWSAFARVDSAVIAQGVIAVDGSRKTVQHFEGGIVRKINVREGQRVEKDAVLFELDPTSAQANLAIVSSQLDSALALEARLVAERDSRPVITFPDELLARGSLPQAAAAMADQQKQFDERRNGVDGQIAILNARIDQRRTEISGLETERVAVERQLAAIDDELMGKNILYKKKLIAKTQILALQREKARLDGLVGRSIADRATAEAAIGETRLQIEQVNRQRFEEVGSQMLDARQKISDSRERVSVATDVFGRLLVRAPIGGYVQNMKVFTLGAVVQSGQAMLDIVPVDETLIVQARISPLDIESVKTGMNVEVRFPSFKSRTFPLILGKVTSVSADELVDEKSGQSYYLAQIMIDDSKIERAKERLIAGLPTQILAPTGERTVLEYLVDPLTDRLRTSFREH